jgi:hypothetical protein
MHPVVLIPGIGGSVLVPRGHEYRPLLNRMVPNNRWIHIYAFTNKEISKWKRDMAFDYIYDKDGNIIRMKPQQNIVPFDVGGTKGIKDIVPEFLLLPVQYQKVLDDMFHFRYFQPICESSYKLGYKDHKTLLGVPNDFRFILDPYIRHDFFESLKLCIERGCYFGGEKGIVVTHSLGGVLFKWFLSAHVKQEWIDKHIKQWVSICAPFGGSYQALRAVCCGEHYVSSLRPYVQKELQQVGGIIMCLPNELAFDKEEVLLDTKDMNIISHSKYPELASYGYTPFKIWNDLYKPHMHIVNSKVNVPTHIVYSRNVPTYGKAYAERWDDIHMQVESCDGDGIVPLQSLQSYSKILDMSRVTETIVPNSDHTLLLGNDMTLDIIKSYM